MQTNSPRLVFCFVVIPVSPADPKTTLIIPRPAFSVQNTAQVVDRIGDISDFLQVLGQKWYVMFKAAPSRSTRNYPTEYFAAFVTEWS